MVIRQKTGVASAAVAPTRQVGRGFGYRTSLKRVQDLRSKKIVRLTDPKLQEDAYPGHLPDVGRGRTDLLHLRAGRHLQYLAWRVMKYCFYDEHMHGATGWGSRTWGRRPRQAIAGPKVMLINHRSGSDSEVTPMGFRDLGLGRIVGTPTAGGVIATGSCGLINGGTIRTPGSLVVT
jgi:Peptidase family S41